MSEYCIEAPQEGYKVLQKMGDETYVAISASTMDKLRLKLDAIARALESFKKSSDGFGQADYVPFLKLDNYTFRSVEQVDGHIKMMNDLKENCHSYFVSMPSFMPNNCIIVKERVGWEIAKPILSFRNLEQAEATLRELSDQVAGC